MAHKAKKKPARKSRSYGLLALVLAVALIAETYALARMYFDDARGAPTPGYEVIRDDRRTTKTKNDQSEKIDALQKRIDELEGIVAGQQEDLKAKVQEIGDLQLRLVLLGVDPKEE